MPVKPVLGVACRLRGLAGSGSGVLAGLWDEGCPSGDGRGARGLKIAWCCGKQVGKTDTRLHWEHVKRFSRLV